MDPSLQHKFFNSGPCLSKEKLLEYHSRSLSPMESNEVEKHLLDCEMCSEALEGITLAAAPEASIESIDQQIKILTGTTMATGAYFNWKKGMALAAGITGVLLGIFWLLKDVSPEQNLAENQPKKKEKVVDKSKDQLPKKDESTKEKNVNKQEAKLAEVESITAEKIEQDGAADQQPVEVPVLSEPDARLEASDTELADADNYAEDIEVTTSSSEAAVDNDLVWSNDAEIAENSAYNVELQEAEEELAYGLSETDEIVVQKDAEETLPQAYIKQMLVVDYSNIYTENDTYPERNKSSDSKRSNAKEEAAMLAESSSVPASVESEDVMSESILEDANSSTIVVEYSYENVLERALEHYQNAQHALSLDYLNEILRKYPEDHNALFYSGMNHLKLGHYDKAIALFDQVYFLDKTPFQEDAEFNRALALKGKGEVDLAKALFQQIVDRGGYYASFAKEELEKF